MPTADDLAAMLTTRTWTLCSGFYVEGHPDHVFLNDATSEDGAQEYAVCRRVREDRFVQVESITFSWCTEAQAAAYVRQAITGSYDAGDIVRPVDLAGRLDPPEAHARCPLCA